MSEDETKQYALLDSGGGRKLEKVGPYILERQATAAFWSPRLPPERWAQAHAVHHRSEDGGGNWEFKMELPERWPIQAGPMELWVKPTPFGHLGLFPEHAAQWEWMQERITRRADYKDTNVLNLFAYTGVATLACAAAGAEVVHVDSSKGTVAWARENATLSGLEDRATRWIVDDCLTFVQREVRRERTYHGLILDPPTYGRSKGKDVWKIEQHLPELLHTLEPLVATDAVFIVLTCHTPGFTPTVLTNLLFEVLDPDLWEARAEEMVIPDSTGRLLPAGTVVRCVPQ